MPSNPPSDQRRPNDRPATCPECGAEWRGDADSCWLCKRKLGGPVGPRGNQKISQAANPYASPAPPRGELGWTFNLSTLFLWTALAAVIAGVVRIAPGLGIALAVVSIPAALHSVGVAAYRRRKSGVALSVSEKILAFVASFALFLAIAIAIWIAAIGALLVICLSSVAPSGKGAAGTELVVILVAGTGVVFMLSFAFFIVRGLWRAKR